MAKLFSILLSGLIFIQSFNISLTDFSKLSVIMNHLNFHQENYGDTVMDFVSVHYSSTQILHSEEHEHDDEHSDLPFKQDPQTNQNIPVVFIINNTTIDFDNDFFIEIHLNFFYKESLSQFEKPTVFQPPQKA